ncbi:unnamed protein product [Cylindrotheca closterium]|uniref:Uncharacterized protein n=1 Tax=Cylindrotheca closterium TaxID=2856 RepID=A0AAD2FH16_9STRA|nr:unnamed protein product [Cylindrotheca closterium]
MPSMQSKPQSKFSEMTVDGALSHRSESEFKRIITRVQKPDLELLNHPHRPRAVSVASSDGESEADSEENPSSFSGFKSVHRVSLHYGDLSNEPTRQGPTMEARILKTGANPRKLTLQPNSLKPTPTTTTKNYKHKKHVLQIADPESIATRSITRVLSCNKKGRKSIRRVSLWVGEPVL